jgi:hypothetical protein
MNKPTCNCIKDKIGNEYKLLHIQPGYFTVNILKYSIYNGYAAEEEVLLQRNFCPQCGKPYEDGDNHE